MSSLSNAAHNKPELHKDPLSVVLSPFLEQRRVLDIKQVAATAGISVPHVRYLVRTQKFPAPIRVGARKLGWPMGAFIAFLEGRSKAA